MRIDPKPFTFDANDRAVLVAALEMYAAAKARARAQLKGLDESSRRAIDANEMRAARVADLLAILRWMT